jgi:hypothetical protein
LGLADSFPTIVILSIRLTRSSVEDEGVGFGLAWRLEKRLRWFTVLCVTVFASLLFTFSIELTQVFMPSRTSSWYDVAANTMRGTIGLLMFRVLGGYIERVLSAHLTSFYGALRESLLGGFFVAYALAAIFVSIPLNRMTILRNWDDSLPLLVGNTPLTRTDGVGASLKSPLRIGIWARLRPSEFFTMGLRM